MGSLGCKKSHWRSTAMSPKLVAGTAVAGIAVAGLGPMHMWDLKNSVLDKVLHNKKASYLD